MWLENPGAKDAFAKLVRKGVDERGLGNWLRIAVSDLILNPDRDWKHVSRKELIKERQQLKRFAGRVRRMAQLIKWTDVRFLKLPATLHEYAKYLEEQKARHPRIGRHVELQYQKRLQIWLVEYIHRATGHFYYEEAATLLTAAFHLAEVDKVIDAQALKMRYGRNLKMRFQAPDIQPELAGVRISKPSARR